MAKWVKNSDTVDHTWAGQLIEASAYYQIQTVEDVQFASNSKLLTDIGAGLAVMAYDDSGSNDITDVNSAIEFLKNSRVPEFDPSGNIIQRVAIREEFYSSNDTPTGGRYQAQGYDFPITHAIGTWANFDISFPYPISIFSTAWIHDPLFKGDFVQVLALPDTITGVITANVAAGATVIDVSQTVVDNVSKGFKIKLFDGTNQDDMGRVISIDETNLKLTMETATTNAFLAATPTYCQQTIEFIPHLCLQSSGRVELAKDVVGGSYVPSNGVIRVRYKNNEGTTTGKVFSYVLEYKY